MCASFSVCKIAVAKNRKLLAARGMSRERASESGLPVSIDSARASFSRSRSIRSAMCRRIFDRSAAGFFDQSTNVFSAAATARSTSRASLSATCEYGFPVAGSMLSTYLPPTGSTNRPSIKFRIWSGSAVNAQHSTSNAQRAIRMAVREGFEPFAEYSQVPQDELIADSAPSPNTQIRAQIGDAVGRDLSQVVAAWSKIPAPLKAA